MFNKKTIGFYGEDIAENFLIRNGYKILERNLKTGYKEIDIVAMDKEETVFVEVKTRTSTFSGDAEEALDNRKIKNFKKAVEFYLYKNAFIQNFRLDFIAVDVDRKNKKARIKHFKDVI